jgi:hypothetical protein
MSITNFLDVTVDWTGLNASYVFDWGSGEEVQSPVLLLDAEFDGENCSGNLTYGNIFLTYERINQTSPRIPGYCEEDGYYYAWLNLTAYPSVTTEVKDVRGLFKYFAARAAETGLAPFLEAIQSATSAVMVPYDPYASFTLYNEGDYYPSDVSNCSGLQRQWDDGNFTTISVGRMFDYNSGPGRSGSAFDWNFFLNYADAQSCEEALFEFNDSYDMYDNITDNLNCAGECFDFEPSDFVVRRANLEVSSYAGFALDKAGIMDLFSSSDSDSDSDPSGSSRSAVGIMGTLAMVAVSLTVL